MKTGPPPSASVYWRYTSAPPSTASPLRPRPAGRVHRRERAGHIQGPLLGEAYRMLIRCAAQQGNRPGPAPTSAARQP